jgi:hypothetical protein
MHVRRTIRAQEALQAAVATPLPAAPVDSK